MNLSCAVAIETAVRDLLENAELAVDAGMHIHLDKPAGSSLPVFQRILEKASRKKLVVQMGYMYRYNPAVVLLRELLDQEPRARLRQLERVHDLHPVLALAQRERRAKRGAAHLLRQPLGVGARLRPEGHAAALHLSDATGSLSGASRALLAKRFGPATRH